MQFAIDRINLDPSTQCRAAIDPQVVTEYAEAMRAGSEFPPVLLFGDEDEAWIGDGWHRVVAASSLKCMDIQADLQPGGRLGAIQCALRANSTHGQRRTNADKRRCVEIALREFPDLSSRAIAEMSDVSHTLVESVRPATGKVANEPEERKGKDGAKRKGKRKEHKSDIDGWVSVIRSPEPKKATQFPPDEEKASTDDGNANLAAYKEGEDVAARASAALETSGDRIQLLEFEALKRDISDLLDKLAEVQVGDHWLEKFLVACHSLEHRIAQIRGRWALE